MQEFNFINTHAKGFDYYLKYGNPAIEMVEKIKSKEPISVSEELAALVIALNVIDPKKFPIVKRTLKVGAETLNIEASLVNLSSFLTSLDKLGDEQKAKQYFFIASCLVRSLALADGKEIPGSVADTMVQLAYMSRYKLC